MPFAQCFPRGNLGEGDNAAEPDVVDPSPGLGDGGKESIPAFGFHRWLCPRLMKDALDGCEARRRPRQRDRPRRMEAGSRTSEAGVFGMNRFLPRGSNTNRPKG